MNNTAVVNVVCFYAMSISVNEERNHPFNYQYIKHFDQMLVRCAYLSQPEFVNCRKKLFLNPKLDSLLYSLG